MSFEYQINLVQYLDHHLNPDWYSNGALNTEHLNTEQVKVRYSDVSVIQIPTVLGAARFQWWLLESVPHVGFDTFLLISILCSWDTKNRKQWGLKYQTLGFGMVVSC